MGWHTAEDTWWPVISEGLTGKWSREAALMDLRWYGDRRNYTGRAMPGRRALSKRWNWKPGAVRWLLASDEWVDSRWEGQPSSSPLTTRLQPAYNPAAARLQPAKGSSKVGNGDDNSPPTARLQPANDPPTARLQPSSSPPFIETPSQAPPPHPTSTEAEVSAPPPAVAGQQGAGLPFGQAAPKADKPAKVNKRAAAQRIYDAWQASHPLASEVPSKGGMKKLVDRLDETAKMLKGKRARYTAEDWTTAEQDLIDMSEWVHLSPDTKWWRGENPAGTKHLGIATIYKEEKLGTRLEKTVTWRAEGRPTRRYSGKFGDSKPPPKDPEAEARALESFDEFVEEERAAAQGAS